MTFLPIVERELRVASRQKPTHWLRFFAALTVIVVGLAIIMGNARWVSPPYLGRLIFRAVSTLGFGFCLLAGVFLTSDCLCSEKREGTLGLLFLTDLKGYDVVLGKLAATSMVSIYALLAIVPMLGLPLLMGGVSAAEFGRMVLALLDTLLLSLAAGMCASAICRDTRTAMLATFGQMCFLTGVLYLLAWGVSALFKITSPSYLVMLPSPLLAFLHSSDTTRMFLTKFSSYWASIGVIGMLALAQLALAIFLLPRSWQEKDSATRPANAPRPRAGEAAARLEFNPFFWLATRDKFPGRALRLVFGFMFAAWWVMWFAGLVSDRRPRDELMMICMSMAYALHFLAKGLMAVQASRHLCEDRRSGALELLLVTPLAPTAILEGQWRALRIQFNGLKRMLWALNAGLVVLFVTAGGSGMPSDVALTFTGFFVGGAILLTADFHALGWLGMAEALTGKRHHRAVLHTLGLVIAPPIIVVFLFGFVTAGSGLGTAGVNLAHLIFFTVSLLFSRWIGLGWKRSLGAHFRQLASGEVRRPRVHGPTPGYYWVPQSPAVRRSGTD